MSNWFADMAKASAGEKLDERVRRRLRELREERGLTLQEVAAAASIDVSTLSRLESGKRRLALDLVPGLAAALGVRADQVPAGRAVDPRVRAATKRRDGLTMRPLSRHGPGHGFHAYKIEISVRRRKPPAELAVHGGHDWLFVISGRLRLLLDDEETIVEPGDAVEFSTWTPHWFGAVDGPVELIALFGPEGERHHLR
jgi:transcriptional regulator with XRE-family HTH domain